MSRPLIARVAAIVIRRDDPEADADECLVQICGGHVGVL